MVIRIKKKAALNTPEPAKVKAKEKVSHGRMLDGMCKVVISKSPSAIVPWLLMASYMYYHRDMPILTDGYYDELAKTLHDTWDAVEHMHKHLINKEDLESGSLYQVKRKDYPNMTVGSALHLVRGEWGITIKED